MEILEPHNSKLNLKMHIYFPAYPKCNFHHFCYVLTQQKEKNECKIN